MLKFSPKKLEKLSHSHLVQSNVKKVSQLTLNFSEAKSEGKMIYANKRRKGKMGDVKAHIERRSSTKSVWMLALSQRAERYTHHHTSFAF